MTSAGKALPAVRAGQALRARPAGGRRPAGLAVFLVVGTVASLLFVLPLAWAIFRSLLPSTMVVSAPSRSDFSHLTFGNYSGLIRGGDILHYTLNSLLVAVMTAAATAVAATMAGYGFARFRFRGSGIVFALVLATLMVPFQALLTPLFLEMHSLGLTNNLVGLALFYTTFNLPFGVFVMRNTFLQIPWELSEQAAVDGASAARTLLLVLRPLVVPGIATTVLYAFLFSWTEFVGALTFLTSSADQSRLRGRRGSPEVCVARSARVTGLVPPGKPGR